MRVLDITQSKAAETLGGPITFVGALPSLYGFILALRDPPADAAVWNNNSLFFEERQQCPVKGDIIVIASDKDGDEMDLNVDETMSLFRDLDGYRV